MQLGQIPNLRHVRKGLLAWGSFGTLIVRPTQKVNFSAACMSRGGAVFTTWPNKALEKSPLTAAGPKNGV